MPWVTEFKLIRNAENKKGSLFEAPFFVFSICEVFYRLTFFRYCPCCRRRVSSCPCHPCFYRQPFFSGQAEPCRQVFCLDQAAVWRQGL
jgi:hypothetical protein